MMNNTQNILSMYKYALTHGKLCEHMPDILSHFPTGIDELLLKKPKTTLKKIKNICNFPQSYLESLCTEMFSTYDLFVVFGCPLSTDIDVVVFVNSIYNNHGNVYPLFSYEYERLVDELKNIGYDTDTKEIDISLVVLENKNIVALSKAGRETQNIINHTYHLHKQKYSLPLIDSFDVDIFDKCRAISKYYLDNLKSIAKDYEEIRYEKADVYVAGTSEMINYCKTIILHINLENTESIEWINTMKSLVMKYVQLILLEQNLYEYTKNGLIKIIGELCGKEFPSVSVNVEWFLMRGKSGFFSKDLIPFLHTKFISILEKYESQFDVQTVSISFDDLVVPVNIEIIGLDLFTEFLSSPVTPTEKFTKIWTETYNDVSLNKLFETKSTIESKRGLLLKFFDETYHSNFLWQNQRSNEWINLLTYYTCGKNSKNIGTDMQSKYNLIRGCLSEIVICNSFDPSTIGLVGFEKIELGLLVENTKEKSKGCAPDLLLVSDTEIIQVEIKCLKTDRKNSDYYREFDLAKKQSRDFKNIIKTFSSPFDMTKIIKRSLIILSYYKNDILSLETFLFNL